jgi:reverse gyrase
MEGAHECIRPTRPADAETITRLINEGIIEPVIRLGREHISIYNLIFNRFIASQSKAAVVRKQVMELSVSLTLSNGDVVKVTETPLKVENFIDVVFDGFMRFYKPLKIGGYIPLRRYELLHGNFRLIIKSATQLLTQASLINMMKREGIGRTKYLR